MIRKAVDWLRFHGWRNPYWREDAWSARCPHDLRTWIAGDLFCMDCGTPLAHSITDSSNTTYVPAPPPAADPPPVKVPG